MKIDTFSDTWRVINAHICSKESFHLTRLQQKIDERDSDFTRGYLSALNELKELAKDKPTDAKKVANAYP